MIILYGFVFVFGLIVGSALNALEYRFRNTKSFVKGRSECPKCKHELHAIDLIPVVSWVVQGGKCRYCKKPISAHYPAIELLTGISFALFVALSGYVDFVSGDSVLETAKMLLGFVYIGSLVFILLYDAKHMIIPNDVVYPLIVLGFVGSWLILGFSLTQVLLGGAIGFGFFGLMYLLSQGKWIGMGDVKLGLALGFMLGAWQTVLMIFFAYVIGASVVVFLLYTKRKKRTDKIAFGPFLAISSILSLVVGPYILDWYISLL